MNVTKCQEDSLKKTGNKLFHYKMTTPQFQWCVGVVVCAVYRNRKFNTVWGEEEDDEKSNYSTKCLNSIVAHCSYESQSEKLNWRFKRKHSFMRDFFKMSSVLPETHQQQKVPINRSTVGIPSSTVGQTFLRMCTTLWPCEGLNWQHSTEYFRGHLL